MGSFSRWRLQVPDTDRFCAICVSRYRALAKRVLQLSQTGFHIFGGTSLTDIPERPSTDEQPEYPDGVSDVALRVGGVVNEIAGYGGNE